MTVQLGDGLHVVLAEPQVGGGQVLLQPLRVHRFRDHRRTPLQGPGNQHLCRAGVVVVGDVMEDRVFQQHRFILGLEAVRAVGGAQRGIGGQVNALLLAEAQHLFLLQIRMQFDLVHGRFQPCLADQVLQLFHAEVGDADLSGQVVIHQCFHGGPGRCHGQIIQRHHVIAGLGKGHALLQGHRPMHQVQVQIIQLQVVQGGFQGRLHILRGMVAVPQLGGDPQVLALYGAGGEHLLQRLADFILVAVNMGTVDVPVTHLDGGLHGLVDLAGPGFPGTQSQLRHGIAVGKCQCFHHLLL